MEKSIHHSKYRILIGLLREKREANGLTQIELAKKLSISQTVISKIETCERRLDVIELMTVCEAIEIPFMAFINEFNKKIK